MLWLMVSIRGNCGTRQVNTKLVFYVTFEQSRRISKWIPCIFHLLLIVEFILFSSTPDPFASVLAIPIYHKLAILEVEAVSQIVTSIAYKRRHLDSKLMYTQNPLDLLLNYSKFDQKTHLKAAVILLTWFAIALKFIPTILTKTSSADIIHYNSTINALNKDQATSRFN